MPDIDEVESGALKDFGELPISCKYNAPRLLREQQKTGISKASVTKGGLGNYLDGGNILFCQTI